MNEMSEIEKAKLNLETAQVAWTELQRFFAQGSVIWADESLDLIEVAFCIAQDDSDTIQAWMKKKRVAPVTDEQAKRWLAEDVWLWSVVVRPLILVQHITESKP
ncbi:MAG: DUF2288 domain-containing protein [Proteobacteria bacterium]|nr:DUF2288 domain-containing protein [Pseudomonadota bacterium]